MSMISVTSMNAVLICDCTCHKTGVFYYKPSLPPQPCCNCIKGVGYESQKVNDNESKAIWKILGELQERIIKIETTNQQLEKSFSNRE